MMKMYCGLGNIIGIVDERKLMLFEYSEHLVVLGIESFNSPIRRVIIATKRICVLLDSGEVFTIKNKDLKKLNLSHVEDILYFRYGEIPLYRPGATAFQLWVLLRDGHLYELNEDLEFGKLIDTNITKIYHGNPPVFRDALNRSKIYIPNPEEAPIIKYINDPVEGINVVDPTMGQVDFSGYLSHLFNLNDGVLTVEKFRPHSRDNYKTLSKFSEVDKFVVRQDNYLYLQHQTLLFGYSNLVIDEVIDFCYVLDKYILYIKSNSIYLLKEYKSLLIYTFCQVKPINDRCPTGMPEKYLSELGEECCRNTKLRAKLRQRSTIKNIKYLPVPDECQYPLDQKQTIEYQPRYQLGDRGISPKSTCIENNNILNNIMPEPSWVEAQRKYLESLSPLDQHLVSLYTHNGDVVVNSFIRGGDDADILNYIQAKKSLIRILKQTEMTPGHFLRYYRNRLNAIILRSPPTTNDFNVYRGTTSNFYKTRIRRVYRTQGFQSTSLLLSIAQGFSNNGFITIIKIPRGSHVLYLDPLSKNRGEYEILLPDQSDYYIVKGWRFEIYQSIREQYTLNLVLVKEPKPLSVEHHTYNSSNDDDDDDDDGEDDVVEDWDLSLQT